MSTLKNKKIRTFTIIYIIVFLILLVRCFFGFGNIDESFYLTIPYRMIHGDVLFQNEWHLAQLSGYVVFPIVKILYSIMGSLDSFILIFRITYLLINTAVSVFIYITLKKYTDLGAFISSLVFLIYVPFGIPALSYNSVGIITLTVSTLILCNYKNKIVLACGGFIFSLAVLCCPYLVLLYLIYFVFAVCLKNNNLQFLSLETFIYFSIGIVISALLFITFVFKSGLTITNLIKVLPLALSDSEHDIGFATKIYTYFWELLVNGGKTIFAVWILYIIAIGYYLVSKNKTLTTIFVLLISIINMIQKIYVYNYINHLILPLNIAAVFIYHIYRPENYKNLFYCVTLSGIIYSFCIHLSSNNELLAISSAMMVSLVASIVIVVGIIEREYKPPVGIQNKIILLLLYAIICFLPSSLLWYRVYHVFWDKSIIYQTEYIDEGLEKGLYVSPGKKDEYVEYRNDILKIDPSSKLLIVSEKTWLYLCSDFENASYSAWLTEGITIQDIDKLDAYYKLNTQKIPDYIFVDRKYKELIEEIVNRWDYTIDISFESGNQVLKRESN